MKELIKNALILCAITVVAGILLGAVYEITKEPRTEQQEITKINSYKSVLSDASQFEELKADMTEISKLLLDNGITEKNVVIDGCIRATDDKGELKGYIVSVTSKEGYGGNISFSVGFNADGNITGVSILSIGETAGLGMEAKNEEFLAQYKTDSDGMFVVNKADGVEGINVDAISGATITTNAMTKGVNAAKITAGYLLASVDKMEGTENETSEAGVEDETKASDNESSDNETESETTEGGEADE